MISPSLVAELRTLKGGPKVTFPEGDADYPTTERVLNIKRGAHAPVYGQAEPDAVRFPNNELVEQQETGGDAQWVEVYRRYRKLPGPIVTTGTKVDEYGNLLTTTEQVVAASAASGVTNSAGSEQAYQGADKIEGKIITQTYPNSFAQITEIEKVDESIPGSRATVYTYLVATSSAIPPDTATTTYRRIKHPTDDALKIEIKTVYAIPDDFDETDDNGHSFPEVFISAVQDSDFGMYWKFRPGPTGIWPCKIAHSFGTTRQTPVPTIIQEAQWRYPLGFSGRALTDEETLVFVKGASSISLDLPASTPSSTTYLGWIDAPSSHQLLIGGNSRIWRAGIYHTTTIYTDPR